jgi:hypothetical protein
MIGEATGDRWLGEVSLLIESGGTGSGRRKRGSSKNALEKAKKAKSSTKSTKGTGSKERENGEETDVSEFNADWATFLRLPGLRLIRLWAAGAARERERARERGEKAANADWSAAHAHFRKADAEWTGGLKSLHFRLLSLSSFASAKSKRERERETESKKQVKKSRGQPLYTWNTKNEIERLIATIDNGEYEEAEEEEEEEGEERNERERSKSLGSNWRRFTIIINKDVESKWDHATQLDGDDDDGWMLFIRRTRSNRRSLFQGQPVPNALCTLYPLHTQKATVAFAAVHPKGKVNVKPVKHERKRRLLPIWFDCSLTLTRVRLVTCG